MSRHIHDRQAGVSLIEVMVALALGLFVSVGAISLMLGNRDANRSTEAVARVQETTRVAFDLMSRDLRSAGINACSGGVRVMNMLNSPTTQWWTNWTGGLRGFDDSMASGAATVGSGTGDRVANTDLIEIMRGAPNALAVRAHNATATDAALSGVTVPPESISLELSNGQAHSFRAGDLVAVCDYVDTAIFQVSGVDAGANSIAHAASAGSPGNCAATLGFRPVCSTAVTRIFPPGATVMKLEPVAWYVGNNGSTGANRSPTSLYRVSVVSDGAGNANANREEIVEGVTGMQVRYMYFDPLTGLGSYVTAGSVTDWQLVTGVEIVLTIQSPDAGTALGPSGATRLQRTLTHVVNLRNRVE